MSDSTTLRRQIQECFCNDKDITTHEFNTNNDYRWEWYKSGYYKTLHIINEFIKVKF